MKKGKKQIQDASLKKAASSHKPATKFIRVTKEITEKYNKQLIDEDTLRRNRTWSRLANQVIGAEVK